MSTYHVAAKRWGAYWELHIDGVGVTQSRTLLAAERIVRDYLALDGHADAATAGIDIRPELDGDLAAEAEAARQAVRDVEAARKASAARSRVVACRLRRSGLSGADIAAVLGVSTQRVSQLVNTIDAPADRLRVDRHGKSYGAIGVEPGVRLMLATVSPRGMPPRLEVYQRLDVQIASREPGS